MTEDHHVGPYRVISKLGEGGMGVVYLGRHVETGVMVALKTLLLRKASYVESMRREVRALASLDHPGVVRVLEYDVDCESPWYAMEYVDGVSLAELLKGGTPTVVSTLDTIAKTWAFESAMLPTAAMPKISEHETTSARDASELRSLVSVFIQMCDALSAIHDQGIVHRDLKPDNVMVRSDGRAVLVDFGIAAATPGTTGRERFTTNFQTAGTPAYMAPEQVVGDLTDARTDLYALGCMLFELYSGAPPFGGTHPLEVLQKQFSEPPRQLADVVADVDPRISRMVARLLKKDRCRRIAFAFDVDRILRDCFGISAPTYQHPTYVPTPAFVGRVNALSRFEAFLNDETSLLWIRGEAGIGKSRFVDEAMRRYGRRHQVLAAQPSSTGDRLSSAESVVEAIVDAHIDRAEELLEFVGSEVSFLASISPSLRRLPGVEDLGELSSYPESVVRFYKTTVLDRLIGFHVRHGGPTLLVLDNLDRLDEATKDWALECSKRVDGLKLILSTRSAAAADDLLAGRTFEEIELGPLTLAQHTEATCTLLSISNIPETYAVAAFEHTTGNPYHLIDLVRVAFEDGYILRNKAGMWEIGRLPDFQIRLPMTERLALEIDNAVDVLPADSRRALEYAALLGGCLTAATLDKAAKVSSVAVHELFRRSLIRVRADGGWELASDRLRQRLIELIPAVALRQAHQTAADAIRTCLEHPPNAQLAEHYDAAGVSDLAAIFYRAAAEDAVLRRVQTQSTVRYLSGYSRCAESLDFLYLEERVRAISDIGLARNNERQLIDAIIGRIDECTYAKLRGFFYIRRANNVVWREGADEAQRWLDLALIELEQESDARLDGEACVARAYICEKQSDFEGSEIHLREALQFGIASGDPTRVSRTYMNLSSVLRVQRRLLESIEATRLGIAANPNAHKLERAHHYMGLGMALVEIGHNDEAHAIFVEALEIAHDARSYATVCLLSWNLGNGCIQRLQVQEARRYLDVCTSTLRYQEVSSFPGMHSILAAEVLSAEGVFDAARKAYDRAEQLLSASPNQPFASIYLARMERRLGNLDEAERVLEALRSVAEGSEDPYLNILWTTQCAHLQLARNQPAEHLLAAAQALTNSSEFLPTSEPGAAVAQLEEAGRSPCHHGECREWIPSVFLR